MSRCDPWASNSPVTETIFYISGRGGSIQGKTGQLLTQFAKEVKGISLDRHFLAQSPEKQVAEIRTTLDSASRMEAPVIANSYGAYLVLLALIEPSESVLNLLLLSPIIGKTYSATGYFRPPMARRLESATASGSISLNRLEIHVGEKDEGFSKAPFAMFAKQLNADLFSTYPNEGHSLKRELLVDIVAKFLRRIA